MARMPKQRRQYLETFKSRHGKRMWFFRPVRKGPRIRLPDEYGSPAFDKAYKEALAKHVSGELKSGKTIAWLIDQFLASPVWATTAQETKKQFTYQFARMKKIAGEALIEDVTTETIVTGRQDRAHKPSDANKYLKATSALFRFAIDQHWLSSNPVAGVKKVPMKSKGFHTWTEEEAKQFEDHWPVGTRERLAFDLLVYTGVRRSDVVRLGRQHTRQGEITITTEKSRNSGRPVEVTISVLPPLAASINAAPTGDMTYLVTSKRTAFKKTSFGNWFKKACKAAKVPGSSHGLRKLAAVRMAENGATEAELNAVFGWTEGSDESATYVKKASRKKLGKAGIVKMLPQTPPQTSKKKAGK